MIIYVTVKLEFARNSYHGRLYAKEHGTIIKAVSYNQHSRRLIRLKPVLPARARDCQLLIIPMDPS